MAKNSSRFIKPVEKIILLVLFLVASCFTAQAQALSFDSLLKESKLIYTQPDGFIELKSNKETKHIKSKDLEIRYSINPISRVNIEYQDPHNAAPMPNDLFEMLFRQKIEQLAHPKNYNIEQQQVHVEVAQEQFNAGWASIAVFNTNPKFFPKYQFAMLVAIHKNDLADAYILFLTNNLVKSKALINKAMSSLKFSK